MNWIDKHIKAILLVTGAVTLSMLLAALAPQAALQMMFGVTLQGAAAEIVVRNWGALIAMGGGLLVYAAYRPASRPLAMTLVLISKLVFIALVLVFGQAFLRQAAVALVFDGAVVLLFAAYLWAGPHQPAGQA